MSKAPTFRHIGTPLDVADTDLDHLNRRLGVPTLVASPPPEPETRKPPRAAPTRPLNVHVPDYVYRAIRDRAHQQETSTKFIVMKALADTGIAIDPADLVADGRRSRS